MFNSRRVLIVAAILAILVAGLTWHAHKHHVPAVAGPGLRAGSTHLKTQKYTHFTIVLKGGKLVGAASDYLVNPGTGLEFSIVSDVLGKVSVPTDPAETITFTQSPLVFHFTAPTKGGVYQMAYQANGSNTVIQIGVITVRSNK